MKIKLVSLFLAMVSISLLSACGQPTQNNIESGISGSITAVGSSALQPLADKAATLFMDKNSEVTIQVQGGGSGTGLKQVSEGAVEIGNSDIFAEEKLTPEKAAMLVDNKVCVSGIAAIVNPNVNVDNLSKQQLIDIFTGKITNWKDVGGNNLSIVIVNRPSSSGTRATFKKYALDGAEEAQGKALTGDQSGTVKKTVAETAGAISYLSFTYIDKSVKALKYDGVEPTAQNVKTGIYPIWSYEHMYINKEASKTTKAFIQYIMSDEFKPYIAELGYIPSSDMKGSRDN